MPEPLRAFNHFTIPARHIHGGCTVLTSTGGKPVRWVSRQLARTPNGHPRRVRANLGASGAAVWTEAHTEFI